LREGRCTVHLGRVVVVLRQHLQPGEQQQDDERRRLPDVHRDERHHGEIGRSGPGHGRGDDAEMQEYGVHDAIHVVEHAAPHLGRTDRGDRARNQDGGAQGSAAGELRIERKRDAETEAHLERDGNTREDERVAQRPPPFGIAEQSAEVGEPDKAGGTEIEQRRVCEAEPERSPQRAPRYEHTGQQYRREKKRGDAHTAPRQAVRPRLRYHRPLRLIPFSSFSRADRFVAASPWWERIACTAVKNAVLTRLYLVPVTRAGRATV